MEKNPENSTKFIMIFYNKIQTFLRKPGQYFRYKKKFLRGLYFHFSRLAHFKTFYSRVPKINFSKLIIDKSDLILKNEGYKSISYTKLIKNKLNINEVLKKIKVDLKNIDLNKLNNTDDGILSLKSSKDFNCESPELKFVTNKYLIEIVSRYLKCVPILTNLSIWYSPNNKSFEDSSQKYHLDHEDYKQVKGFLFIDDVDLDTGPLTVINELQSSNIQKLINYDMTKSNKRVDDETIKSLKKKNIIINENIMTGKSGDLLLCDTSSCFHFGSRLGEKPRTILAFQFITPFGFAMDWDWKNSEKLPFKDYKCDSNSLLEKVLGNKI